MYTCVCVCVCVCVCNFFGKILNITHLQHLQH